MRFRQAVALLSCYLLALPLFGWWETGHQTIARIAAAHLSPHARARVAALLHVANTPAAVADAMAAASTWADETKAETHTGEWHYIDLALQDSERDIPERCPGGNCVTERILLFSHQLAKRTRTGVSDADALRYLIHFVGDIHQPLHAISDADLGGNCERIVPFEGATNLHALWDGGIIASMNTSARALAVQLDRYIAALPRRVRTRWSGGNATTWTWESHLLAEQVIYQRLEIPTEPLEFPHGCRAAPVQITSFQPKTDTAYIAEMRPIVTDQLAKAGLRLARLLNQSLR